VVIGWFACASFWAFHWMFDRSELLEGRWLKNEVESPARWVQINVGLEETTLPLERIFPAAQGQMLDIYNPDAMTEPAITRARSRTGDETAPLRASELPVKGGSTDLVVVMLAAHEIRHVHSREQFFRELARIVSPRGTIVLVEHLRDLAAVMAFGPGAFHFLPRREWLRLARLSGIEVVRERAITPFVRVFVLRHPTATREPAR
jgi:SAM-dependent methyltransferase